MADSRMAKKTLSMSLKLISPVEAIIAVSKS